MPVGEAPQGNTGSEAKHGSVSALGQIWYWMVKTFLVVSEASREARSKLEWGGVR